MIVYTVIQNSILLLMYDYVPMSNTGNTDLERNIIYFG